MNIKNKKIKVLIFYFCTVILLIMGLLFIDSGAESNYLYINIDRNNNVNNPTYYKEIIKKARDEYNNNDVVGILEIDNTDYVVPIMQSSDNEYYLNHTPNGKESFMGSIYLDYRVDIDSSKKLLIYGHNSLNIDMPFKILEEFYDKDYYDSHRYVEITTSNTKKKYEIFSVYVETSDFSYMNINFEDEDDYLNHIEKLKSKSIYDTGVEVTKDDEILILQTCSEHPDYRNYQKKYLLIILRRV